MKRDASEVIAEMDNAASHPRRKWVSWQLVRDWAHELRATLPAAEPADAGRAVAWFTDDHLTDKSATTYDPVVAERWRAKGWPVHTLYTRPPSEAVDDAAIERLAVWLAGNSTVMIHRNGRASTADDYRDRARAALTAALASQQAVKP